jgi:hypothetical protein
MKWDPESAQRVKITDAIQGKARRQAPRPPSQRESLSIAET